MPTEYASDIVDTNLTYYILVPCGLEGFTVGEGDIVHKSGPTWYAMRGNNKTAVSLTISATTTIDAYNRMNARIYASSALTAWTAAYSQIIDGCDIVIDYQKTTASNCIITFPSGTIISAGSDASISGTAATLVSSTAGRYTITISNMNGTYKVWIVRDIA